MSTFRQFFQEAARVKDGETRSRIDYYGDTWHEKYVSRRRKWVLHREDGPAFKSDIRGEQWWLNGERHREGGPAFDSGFGHKEWWINGKQVSEIEHLKHMVKTGKHNPTGSDWGKIL